MISTLIIILTALVLGQFIRFLAGRKIIPESVPASEIIQRLQVTVFLGLSPIIAISSFWVVELNNIKFAALPLLGVTTIVLGGILGFLASGKLKLDSRQTGSLIISGSYTNLGTIGGLVCYMFFGEMSYAYVSLFKLLEEFLYYLVGFPIAKYYGSAGSEDRNKKNTFIKVLTDPFLLVYLVSIIIGISLNQSGLARPLWVGSLNKFLIPFTSFCLVLTFGFNIRINAVGRYKKECAAILLIKAILVPVIITSVAYLIGLGSVMDGLLLKIVLVLSSMPPAFNSLLPPRIYNLDLDQSNSCWLCSMAFLVVTVPVLYVVQSLL